MHIYSNFWTDKRINDFLDRVKSRIAFQWPSYLVRSYVYGVTADLLQNFGSVKDLTAEDIDYSLYRIVNQVDEESDQC